VHWLILWVVTLSLVLILVWVEEVLGTLEVVMCIMLAGVGVHWLILGMVTLSLLLVLAWVEVLGLTLEVVMCIMLAGVGVQGSVVEDVTQVVVPRIYLFQQFLL